MWVPSLKSSMNLSRSIPKMVIASAKPSMVGAGIWKANILQRMLRNLSFTFLWIWSEIQRKQLWVYLEWYELVYCDRRKCMRSFIAKHLLPKIHHILDHLVLCIHINIEQVSNSQLTTRWDIPHVFYLTLWHSHNMSTYSAWMNPKMASWSAFKASSIFIRHVGDECICSDSSCLFCSISVMQWTSKPWQFINWIAMALCCVVPGLVTFTKLE